MSTPRRFSVPNEKRRIIKMYMDLRVILETTLANMRAADELSASKIDVAVKAIRQLPALLLEIERIQAEEVRKTERKKELLEVTANLPAPSKGKPAADPEFPAELPVELPFKLNAVGR